MFMQTRKLIGKKLYIQVGVAGALLLVVHVLYVDQHPTTPIVTQRFTQESSNLFLSELRSLAPSLQGSVSTSHPPAAVFLAPSSTSQTRRDKQNDYKKESIRDVVRWPSSERRNGSALAAIEAWMRQKYGSTVRSSYIRRWTDTLLAPTNISQVKTILYYNDFVHNKGFYFGEGREPFQRSGCAVDSCIASSNRALIKPEQADAIIWHQRSSTTALPSVRSPHTRLVYFMMESASYLQRDLKKYKNIFNYTMTYKLNSDIYNPYGIFVRRKIPLKYLESKNYALGKSKMAVWFASNCKTKSYRESLVARLQNFVDVDVYGICGNFSCPKINNQNPEKCFRMIEKKYKFYFSFENSLCSGYVTEKFFRTAQYDVIPVVYGLGEYDVLAPPHSYINALDFENVEDLAAYLKYLDSNDTAYNEYFRWKVNYVAMSHYKMPKSVEYRNISWCQLCEMLHKDRVPQTYSSIAQFHSPTHCISGKHSIMRKFMFSKLEHMSDLSANRRLVHKIFEGFG